MGDEKRFPAATLARLRLPSVFIALLETAPHQDPEVDLATRGRVFAEAQAVEHLVDDHGLDLVAVAQLDDVRSADANHSAPGRRDRERLPIRTV
jgi:hypothetical protein